MQTWLDNYFENPQPVGMRLAAITATFGHELDEPQFLFYLQANMSYHSRQARRGPPWILLAPRYATQGIQVEKKIDLVNSGFELSNLIERVDIVQNFGGGYLVKVAIQGSPRVFVPNLATDMRLSGLDEGAWHYDIVISEPFS
ncbi:hypothetical protein [Paraburkholderia terrae]|uniref:Uncharacterized protein n=1 Tax=Paraburkholderia terrae TaxID=311230 RepID=A0A2I8F483_9BURK|nr:hypothetical protein [Paraburkholderia terrae]AUT66472.1 hypothetical protein C2L65_43125 [Paraburkholderia terrae]